MGVVQYFLAVLLPAQLALTFPTGNSECRDKCPAGEFFSHINYKCEPCADGFFTSDCNLEDSCHRCFRDCSSVNHLRVIQNCTSKTPLKCACEPGFRCTERDHILDNCRKCERVHDTIAVNSDKHKQTTSPLPLGQTKSCRFSECDSQTPTPAPVSLGAILSPVVFIGFMALLVILFCIYRPQDETCFRQTIAKLCNEKRQDASRKTKESSHQIPRDSFSAKQQPSPLSAANLGPVHVHNPGTVIFSLLSQFTGQVGPNISGGKRVNSEEEEDEKDTPVFHPTSPGIHLSEEEKSRETDNIFFPSQEQGKDCHVSKEEVL